VRWSWPCLLDELVPGYRFLNGGIEADPYHNILCRAAEFNCSHEVALNIVLLGWHTVDAASVIAQQGSKGSLAMQGAWGDFAQAVRVEA
jgi:hypothetical protein